MDIAFTGGTEEQRRLVRQAVAAVGDRHLDLTKFTHTWNVQFLAPGAIDTTPHDSTKTFMVTQNDGTTQIRSDMPFKGQGPYAGTQFFQESVAHELGHHLLGNGPGEGFIGADNQNEIADLFKSTSAAWNPQDKPWDDRPVEGIAETFKDCFLAARRRVYFNRTREKLAIEKYPDFRRLWRQGVIDAVEATNLINYDDTLATLKTDNPGGLDHNNGFPNGFQVTPSRDHHLVLPSIDIPFGCFEAEWPDGVGMAWAGRNEVGGSIVIEFSVLVDGVPVVAKGGAWVLTQGEAPDVPSVPPEHNRAVENWTDTSEPLNQYGIFAYPEVIEAEYGSLYNAASAARVLGPVSSGSATGPLQDPEWTWGMYWVLIGSLATDPAPITIPPIPFDISAESAVKIKMRVQTRGPNTYWTGVDDARVAAYIDFWPDYVPVLPLQEHADLPQIPASVAKADGGLSGMRIHRPGPG